MEENRIIPDIPECIRSFVRDPTSILLFPFTADIVEQIADTFVRVYKNVPNLIDLRKNALDINTFMIIGDIHGDIDSLIRILSYFLAGNVDALIFLGDYVDRGVNSFETLMLLLSVAIMFPSRVILLRGNHEDVNLNLKFGFIDELRRKFSSLSTSFDIEHFISILEKIYEHLSLAAITPLNTLCVHAGIPKYSYNIEELLNIPKPHSLISQIKDIKKKSVLYNLFMQIRWNDSADYELKNPLARGIHGYYIYTENDVKKFLEKNRLARIVKSHESYRGGFQSLFDGLLLHIFSTAPYFNQIKHAYVIEESRDGKRVLRNLNFKIVKKFDRKIFGKLLS